MRNLVWAAVIAGTLPLSAAVLADDLRLPLSLQDPEPAAKQEPKPAVQDPKPPPQEPEPAVQDPEPGVEGSGQDFLDFGRFQIDPWIGLVGSSGDFHSDPQFGGGLLLRAPSPLLSRGLLGLDEDRLGMFLEFSLTSLERSLVPPPPNPDGVVFMASLGFDFAFVQDRDYVASAQIGVQYLHLGNVSGTDDGVGFLFGLMGGLGISENVWFTFNPQISIGKDGQFFYLLGFGLLLQF